MIPLSTLPLPGPPRENAIAPAPEVPEKDQAIDLTWGQKIAVSWSILWPPTIGLLVITSFLPDDFQTYLVRRIPFVFSLIATGLTFAGQAALAFRIVQKNYRSFFIAVVRNTGHLERRLSLSEQVRIALLLLFPAIAVFGLVFILRFDGVNLPQELNSSGVWLRILLFGPLGVNLAMGADYRGFRLQAYRHRRKAHPMWSYIRSFR